LCLDTSSSPRAMTMTFRLLFRREEIITYKCATPSF
jgi:hypothetical protein